MKPGIGTGVYACKEAAGIIGVTSQRVRRWADGYTYKVKYGQRSSKPILQTDRVPGVLSFYELIELMYVREYDALGIRLDHIRTTAEKLSVKFGEYPFASAKLLVSGKELLQPFIDGEYVRPDVGQLVADFAAQLSRSVEIEKDVIARFFPPTYDRAIVLDPAVSAGEPIITDQGTPTRVLFNLWKIEQDIDVVADYYDVTRESVSAAIRFESEWRQSA